MSRLARFFTTALLAVLLVSVLAACGSVASTTTQTQAPGMQTFSITDQLNGTLSVSAPTGTFSKGDPADGTLTLGTTEASLSAADTSIFSAGQWGLSLGALPTNIAKALVPEGQTLTPQIVVDSIKAQMAAAVTQVTFGSSTTVTIGGHPAARVTGTSPQGDVLLLAVDLGNSYLLTTGVTAKGELTTREALLTQIAGSATYTTK